MSLLRSYSFKEEVSNDVWTLFKNANVDKGWDYSLEIIDNAMQGNIKISDDFNFSAYIAQVEKLKKYSDGRARQKILHIQSDADGQESYGVPEEKLNTYAEPVDEYQKIIDDDTVKFAVSEINRIASYIFIENRVDIYRCINQALKGIYASVRSLKKLTDEDPYVAELLKIILGSGYSFAELFDGRGSE